MIGHQRGHGVAGGVPLQDCAVLCIAGWRDQDAGGIQHGPRTGCSLRMTGMRKIGADSQGGRDAIDVKQSAAAAGREHDLLASVKVLLGIFGHAAVGQEGQGADVQRALDW